MNGAAHPAQDWPRRYYHVDQVLEKPGPRTDPDSFSPGETVRPYRAHDADIYHRRIPGAKLSENTMQDSMYRSWRAGM